MHIPHGMVHVRICFYFIFKTCFASFQPLPCLTAAACHTILQMAVVCAGGACGAIAPTIRSPTAHTHPHNPLLSLSRTGSSSWSSCKEYISTHTTSSCLKTKLSCVWYFWRLFRNRTQRKTNNLMWWKGGGCLILIVKGDPIFLLTKTRSNF